MAESVDNLDILDMINDSSDANDEQFTISTKHVEKLVSDTKIEQNVLLLLYGLYKQATEGKCTRPQPRWYEMQAKAKWNAWNILDNMSKAEAMKEYICLVQKIDPEFDPCSKTDQKIGWVNVSSMQNTESALEESDKNIFDYVKEGNIHSLVEVLEQTSDKKKLLNATDSEGMALIHWASDRGEAETLKILIQQGVNINAKDSEGQTALHYAASCGHVDCIELLLTNGIDKKVKDNDDNVASDLTSDSTILKLLL